jgi:integrase
VFRAFRQALAWAADPDRGLLERDPSRGIRNPKRKRHERRDVFPFESWDEVEAVAAELDPRYRAIPIVAAGTGLRPEELFGLHRSDVDRDRRRLHVHRRFTGGAVKEGTKTGAERFVPFGERVLHVLDAMPIRIDTKILFPAPRGGYIDLEKFRYREWSPALRAAGLAHRRVNDLRHTYASWSLAADVPVAKLATMMGTSIAQIEDTYHRFLKTDEQRYATALDSYGVAG